MKTEAKIYKRPFISFHCPYKSCEETESQTEILFDENQDIVICKHCKRAIDIKITGEIE